MATGLVRDAHEGSTLVGLELEIGAVQLDQVPVMKPLTDDEDEDALQVLKTEEVPVVLLAGLLGSHVFHVVVEPADLLDALGSHVPQVLVGCVDSLVVLLGSHVLHDSLASVLIVVGLLGSQVDDMVVEPDGDGITVT